MIVYRELSSLEKDLGIPAKKLYAVSNNLKKHYRSLRIPKRNGGLRKLSVPDELLKSIQRRINEVLLAHMPISCYATAYRYGSTTAANAIPHVGKSLVLKLDILHFFDSVRYSDVKEKAFPPEIYSEPIRILLSRLCYYKDFLPQGAPSSPAITNIILAEFDEKAGHWCTRRGICYTRYCDDMTFSGEFDPGEVSRYIEDLLRPLGFLLNRQKIRIQRPGTRQCVTGIIVNEKPNIPAQYRKALRQELYYCEKYGIASHCKSLGLDLTPEDYARKLLGKVNYVLQVLPENKEFTDYRNWLIGCISKG